MAAFTSDTRGLKARIGANVGDGRFIRINLHDLETGGVIAAGATVVAHVGGQGLTFTSPHPGVFLCTLTATQTTTLGEGIHTLVFQITPAGGMPQTYVSGEVVLGTNGAGPAPGVEYGYVNGVIVAVS